MHAVGHMSDRDLTGRPVRKERLKNATADGSMEEADAIDRSTPAHGQEGHVEGFVSVARILAAQV